MKKTLVFDIDDTISIHTNRDYANAVPIQPVIDKLNKLHDDGYYIKLFTGRGQVSCNGDLDLIIERNKDVLETWLKKHNVKYDELIFGKPLGDWYIDDKGLNVEDFLKADFCELKGGSNSSVYREFNKVIKVSDKSQDQYRWYTKTANFNYNEFDLPKVYSCVVDTLYMEYVDGTLVCDCCNEDYIKRLVDICYKFKNINDGTNVDLYKYNNNLLQHLNSSITYSVIDEINKNVELLVKKQSFYHGDLTLSNVIVKDDILYLIDPNYKKDYCSYLLDLAKIRQSLEGYELLFNYSSQDNRKFRDYFDSLIPKKDLKLVKLLEISHWIRMYDYKDDDEKKIVQKMIELLWREYNE